MLAVRAVIFPRIITPEQIVAARRERRQSKALSKTLKKSYYNLFSKVICKVKVSEIVKKKSCLQLIALETEQPTAVGLNVPEILINEVKRAALCLKHI